MVCCLLVLCAVLCVLGVAGLVWFSGWFCWGLKNQFYIRMYIKPCLNPYFLLLLVLVAVVCCWCFCVLWGCLCGVVCVRFSCVCFVLMCFGVLFGWCLLVFLFVFVFLVRFSFRFSVFAIFLFVFWVGL